MSRLKSTFRAVQSVMILVIIAVTNVLPAHSQTRHDAFSVLLERFVVMDEAGASFVDYDAWKGDAAARQALDAYVADLASMDLQKIEDRDTQFAAWANLYNALTVQLVLDNYPVDSIRQIKSGLFSNGPWKRKLITVAGQKFSLDDIEHGILRERWNDPRVHYAVNCASIGCPNLMPQAWEADTLDDKLDEAARIYVNHPRGVTVIEGNRLKLSSIYKWFREDFGGDEQGVKEHLARYADTDLTDALQRGATISDYGYDWSLNDAGNIK